MVRVAAMYTVRASLTSSSVSFTQQQSNNLPSLQSGTPPTSASHVAGNRLLKAKEVGMSSRCSYSLDQSNFYIQLSIAPHESLRHAAVLYKASGRTKKTSTRYVNLTVT